MKKQMHKHIINTLITLTLLCGFSSCESSGGSSIDLGYLEITNTLEVLSPLDGTSYNIATGASFPVSGVCSDEGASVDVNVNSVTVTTVTCTTNLISFAFQTSWLNEGINLVSIEYTSGEGDSFDLNLSKDTVAPSLTLPTFLDINSASVSSYSISAVCSDDGSVVGTLGGVAISGNCSAGSLLVSGIDTSLEPDASLVLSLVLTDSFGNPSVASTASITKDVAAPTITIDSAPTINVANQNSYSVSGTCSENSRNVNLTIGAVTQSVSCSANAYAFSSLNVSGELDSLTLAVSISQDDASGNNSNFSISTVKDTLIPTLTINAPSAINQVNTPAYSFGGTCSDDGRTITGMLDVIPFSTLCSLGTWIVSGVDTSFLSDTTYVISAATNDAVGNSSVVQNANVIKDTTIALPAINFLSPASGYGNSNSVTIRVSSIGVGDTVEAFSDASCSTPLQSQVAGATFQDMTFANSAEGSYSYYFVVTDSVPNSTPCLGPIVYTEDQTIPSNPLSVSMTSPNDGESTNDSTPQIMGTISALEEGASVELFIDAACTNIIGTDTVSSGAFNVLGSLAVDGSQNGLNQFYLKFTDQAGNFSGCFDTGLSYTLGGGGLAALPKLAMVGSESPSYLVSLEDGNQITWTKVADQANPVDLGTVNAGDVISIEDPSNTADKVDQGDMIESTGACYVVTQGYGTAPWASEAYAGKIFTTHQYRYGQYGPKVFVAAISDTSFVQILQDTDGDSILDVVDYQNIPAGSVHEFTVTIQNNKPWQIVSNNNVNAYYLARSSNSSTYTRDARVLTPAGTDIIGYSWYVTSAENDTNVTAYRNQSGATYTNTDLDVNESMDVGRMRKTSLNNWATRVISDKPVALLQIADGDGINATPHLPINYLATNYGIPRAADYVGIVAPTGVSVTVYNPGGSTVKTSFTLTKNAGAPALAPYAYKYTDGASIAAGTRFACSGPCFMIYDDEGAGADRDETIMMGYTP